METLFPVQEQPITLSIWSRIQLAKIHYHMGSLSKAQFIVVLNTLWEDASVKSQL